MNVETKIAIQQPYFLPSFHYFQLIHSVDQFIVFDDCAMKKKSFITRNSFGLKNKINFTLNVSSISQNRALNAHFVAEKQSVFTKLRAALRGEPFFDEAIEVIDRLEMRHQRGEVQTVSEFNQYSLQMVCNLLMIRTIFDSSSRIQYSLAASAEQKIIDMCKHKSASQYVNLPNGRAMYHKDNFTAAGIDLRFIRTKLDNIFSKNSVIFLIAHFGIAKLKRVLSEAQLDE